MNSVGLIPKRLPFVSSNTAIRYFRHAVSLDERRAKFKANLYNRPTPAESKLGVQPGEMPTPTPRSPPNGTNKTKGSAWDTFMNKWGTVDQDETLRDGKAASEALKMFNEYQESGGDAKGGNGKEGKTKQPAKLATKAKGKPKRQSAVSDDSDENDYAHEVLYIDEDGDGYDDEGRGPMPPTPHKLPETDVLEVWFAGCHCGTPSLPYLHTHRRILTNRNREQT